MKKRILSTLLAVCFIVMLMPGFASAATFTDMPNDYSTTALEAAVANGLLNGSDGKISPNDNLTRAQMATIISRAFGATEQASLATYNDVSQSDWFYADMGNAVKMKVLNGSNGLLNPNSAVTRQEVFTVLARALKLKDGSSADLTTYADKAAVASWALGATAAMISGGYVHGANGVINPAANISRKDFAVLMNNIVKNYIKTAGVVTEIKDGSVMINVPGVTLKNVTVKGNLIIGDGVGNGEVTLDNVKVEGTTIVRGGGVNSFIIKGNSSLGTVTIAKVDGNIRIFVDGSAVEVVEINDGKDDVLVEGNIAKLVIEASDVPVSVQHATIKELTVSASGVDLSIAKDSKVATLLAEGANARLTIAGAVDTLTAAKTAAGAKIEVSAGASVGTFNSAAPKSQITGEGSVKSASVTGNDVKVDTKGTKLTVGSGVTGTTSGGKSVEPGTITTDGQVSSGGSTGGGDPSTPIVVSSIAAAAPNTDGTGSGNTNIGKYTVGAATGTSPSFATFITATKSLVDVVSANTTQGTAKWVGILITTDKDVTSLAVKTPGMTAFSNLAQADIDEAKAAGASGTKTFVWWLKSENIGSGKDISIKVQGQSDNTAVKLNVTFSPYVPVVLSTVTAATPTADGTGSGNTNIGKYTVGAATGTSPSFATVITSTDTLVPVDSASTVQGQAKWVGVLITTDKDVTSLSVKTPSMTAFSNLAQADIDEALAAGATGTKTFVWWLKSENIGSGKDISIKVQGEDDSTAVKLNVTITEATVSTVAQDPGKTGGAGATFDAATITFSGTIDYYPADENLKRTEGNRVGVQITAPTGVTVDKANATFKYTNSNGVETILVNGTKEWMDGDNYVYYYPLVTKASDAITVIIDWDGDLTKYAPETITINIADGTTLKKPAETASKVTRDPGVTGGSSASFDDSSRTFSGIIDYYPADEDLVRTEGNRVGVQITAPSDVSVNKTNATFKYKNSSGVEATLVNGTDNWMDGDNFVYYYPLVAEPGESFTVVIDWDGTGIAYAPETITIKIAAGAKLDVPVKTAQLHDTSNEIADADLVSGYSATAAKGSNEYVDVTVKATDLQYHQNGANKMGFWIGFSVQAPKDAAKLKYAFCAKQVDTETLSAADLETIDASGNKGISFYTELAAESPKTWCKVQWLDAKGNNIGSAVTFKMDLSQVTLKLGKDNIFTSNTVIRNDLTVAANIGLLGDLDNANGTYFVVASGANLTVNSGKSLTVTTSANLVVMNCGSVNAKDGTINYMNSGKSVVYYGASYTDNDLSIGNSAGTDFTLTSSDGYAGVGNFEVTSGGVQQPLNGIVFDGDATLNSNYAIAFGRTLAVLQNKTLTIPNGKTLTVSGKLMNVGAISNSGTIKLEIGGQILGYSILNDLQNGVYSGLVKIDANNYTLNIAGTNVASGVPALVSNLFYNDKALTIKTQGTLTAALDNAKHTAIAVNFNMLSDIIKSDKYYRFVQTNDALKPYVSPEDERVAAVTNGGATAYVKTPTTGWYGNDILSDYYALLILQGKGATIEIYEGDEADSCTTKVATIAIGNNITFA